MSSEKGNSFSPANFARPTLPPIFPTQSRVGSLLPPFDTPSSHHLPVPWFNEPSGIPPSGSIIHNPWRPIPSPSDPCRKRKHSHEVQNQTSYITPYPPPTDSLPHCHEMTRDASEMGDQYCNMGFMDMLESPDIPSPTYGNPCHTGWQDFSWNDTCEINTVHHNPEMPPPPPWPQLDIEMKQDWHRKYQDPGFSHSGLGNRNPNQSILDQQQNFRGLQTQGSSGRQSTQEMISPKTTQRPQQILPQNVAMQQSNSASKSPSRPPSMPPPSSSELLPRQATAQQPVIQPPSVSKPKEPVLGPTISITNPSDVRRKPSLYSIPPWPSPSAARPNQTAATSSQPLAISVGNSDTSNVESPNSSKAKTPNPNNQQSRHEISSASTPAAAPSSLQPPTPPAPPQKHSPNLYAFYLL